MAWATFRPAALFQVKSGFTSDGKIVAWECKGYHAGDRPFLGRRGSETPYDVPHVRVTAYRREPIARDRTGRWAARRPLRPESTSTDRRHARHRSRRVPPAQPVAPALSTRWSAPPKRMAGAPAPREARRWRRHRADVGNYVATCARVGVQGSEVRVDRVTAALDCGLVVQRARATRSRIDRWGIGTALYESMDFRGDRTLTTGFARYRVPRTSDAPAIETLLVRDAETPSTGAGEPGIVPIAAAIANAVFDATGQRCRELPIQRHLR
jgi:CO/xanthine dehydrogenase Mo-binding subunit